VSGLLAFALVGAGGGLGAAARFWVADSVKARRPAGFPWGTWVVNTAGSFVIGFVSGWIALTGAAEAWHLFLVVGFCGGLTTFSTSIVETVTILRDGRPTSAVRHALGTLGASVVAVTAGLLVAGAAVA
jgi:CrcB protein